MNRKLLEAKRDDAVASESHRVSMAELLRGNRRPVDERTLRGTEITDHDVSVAIDFECRVLAGDQGVVEYELASAGVTAQYGHSARKCELTPLDATNQAEQTRFVRFRHAPPPSRVGLSQPAVQSECRSASDQRTGHEDVEGLLRGRQEQPIEA